MNIPLFRDREKNRHTCTWLSNGMQFTFLTCALRQTYASLCPQKVGGMAAVVTYFLCVHLLAAKVSNFPYPAYYVLESQLS